MAADAAAKKDKAASDEEIEELRAQLATASEAASVAQVQAAEQAAAAVAAREQAVVSEQAKQAAEAQATAAQQSLDETSAKLQNMADEISKYQEEIINKSLEIEQLQAQLEALKKSTRVDKEQLKEQLTAQIKSIQSTLVEAQGTLASLKSQFEAQTAKLAESNKDKADLQAQLAALEAKTKENELDLDALANASSKYSSLSGSDTKPIYENATKKSLSYLMLLLKKEVNDQTFTNILKYDNVVEAYYNKLLSQAPSLPSEREKTPITKKDLEYFFNENEFKLISDYVLLAENKNLRKKIIVDNIPLNTKIDTEYGKLKNKYINFIGTLNDIQLGDNNTQ